MEQYKLKLENLLRRIVEYKLKSVAFLFLAGEIDLPHDIPKDVANQLLDNIPKDIIKTAKNKDEFMIRNARLTLAIMEELIDVAMEKNNESPMD